MHRRDGMGGGGGGGGGGSEERRKERHCQTTDVLHKAAALANPVAVDAMVVNNAANANAGHTDKC